MAVKKHNAMKLYLKMYNEFYKDMYEDSERESFAFQDGFFACYREMLIIMTPLVEALETISPADLPVGHREIRRAALRNYEEEIK